MNIKRSVLFLFVLLLIFPLVSAREFLLEEPKVTCSDIVQVSLSWSKVSGAEYYSVQKQYGEEWKVLGYTNLNFYKDASLSEEDTYRIEAIMSSEVSLIDKVLSFFLGFKKTISNEVISFKCDERKKIGLDEDSEYFEEIIQEYPFNNEDGVTGAVVISTEEPVLSNGQPTEDVIEDGRTTPISLVTNIPAVCKSSRNDSNVAYDSMVLFDNTGGTFHSTEADLTGLGIVDGRTYNFYIKCKSTNNFVNRDTYAITFTVRRPEFIEVLSSTGPQHIGVIPFYYSSSGQTLSQTILATLELEEVLFGEKTFLYERDYTINTFYREVSNGYISNITGDVFEWQDLVTPYDQSNNCNPPTQEQVQERLIELGVDLSKYDKFVIFANHSCLSSTKAPFASNVRVLQREVEYLFPAVWTFHPYIPAFEHELGHTFGHSAGYNVHPGMLDCPAGEIIGDNCQFVEGVSNRFDVMSGSGLKWGRDFNTYYKERLGWINQSDLEIINQSGEHTVQIKAMELGVSSNPNLGAKIFLPGKSQAEYYIEYRRPIGVDKELDDGPFLDIRGNTRSAKDNVPGIWIYKRYVKQDGFIDYPLLDMSPIHGPENNGDLLHSVDRDVVALTKDGLDVNIFVDLENDITIGPILAADNETIAFDVKIGSANRPTTPISSFVYAGTSRKVIVEGASLYQVYQVDGAYAVDENGDLASYEWRFVSCSGGCPILYERTGTLFGRSSGVRGPSFDIGPGKSYLLELKVTDQGGLFNTSNVEVIVDLENRIVTQAPPPPTTERDQIEIKSRVTLIEGVSNIKIYVNNLLEKICGFPDLPLQTVCLTDANFYPIGIHSYYSTAEDSIGNIFRDPLSGQKTFEVIDSDITPPILIVDIYETNSGESYMGPNSNLINVPSNKEIGVRAVTSDINKIKNISIDIDGTNKKLCNYGTTGSIDPSCVDESILLSEGIYRLEVGTSDIFSNSIRIRKTLNASRVLEINNFDLLIDDVRYIPFNVIRANVTNNGPDRSSFGGVIIRVDDERDGDIDYEETFQIPALNLKERFTVNMNIGNRLSIYGYEIEVCSNIDDSLESNNCNSIDFAGSPQTSSLSGRFTYYNNSLVDLKPIKDVEVKFINLGSGPNYTVYTDEGGYYSLENAEEGNYKIIPSKIGENRNAISSLDAAHLLQYVARLRSFTSEQKIACDVTSNGALSSLDSARILQYKVGLISKLNSADICGSDWIFIPEQSSNILTQPSFNSQVCQKGQAQINFFGNSVSQDFKGVVIGDCTLNWVP